MKIFGRAPVPWVTLILGSALAIAEAVDLFDVFALSGGAFASQPWRIITYPFVSFSESHFFWDWVPFLLLCFFSERELGRIKNILILSAATLASGLVFLFQGHEKNFMLAGSSGWDSALFAALAFMMLSGKGVRLSERIIGGFLLAVFSAKLIAESVFGITIYVQGGFTPAYTLHLVSALLGISLVILFRLKELPHGNGPDNPKNTESFSQ